MSRLLKPDIINGIKDLIHHITGKQENSEEFHNHEQHCYDLIKKSTDMYFPNLKDLNSEIDNVISKFHYHSFHQHGNYLKKLYDNYIKQFDTNDLTNHLTIIKFLLIMSNNPTEQFWQNPQKFEFLNKKQLEDEQQINWYDYLMEGIDLKPINSNESTDLSDIDGDDNENVGERNDNEIITFNKIIKQRFLIREIDNLNIYDFNQSRRELSEIVQNSWFNSDEFQLKPNSNHPEATIALRWDEFLQKHTHNLVNIQPDNIVTEYKVIREILWQLWGGHNSTIFQFYGNELRIKTNITISSVRQMYFESFLQLFLEYIGIIDEFREFSQSLTVQIPSCMVPETYKCYSNGIQNIIKLFMKQLIKLENQIRQQHSTFTLLNLIDFLKRNFKIVQLLKVIHDQLRFDNFKETLPLICSLKLLINLRKGLNNSCNKWEQNIKLSLYLESIVYYLKIIEDWLVNDDLNDTTREFVVLNKNSYNLDDNNQKNYPNWQMNFELQSDIKDLCNSDSFLKIICNDVLQIGRSLHFLRMLGQYNTIIVNQETIYEEFIKRIFEKLYNYYEIKTNIDRDIDVKSNTDSQYESFDHLNDEVDTNDGFLMKAFEGFLYRNDEILQENSKIYINTNDDNTIFSRLIKLPNYLYPIQQTFETILKQILKERFITSGLMVKNLLIEKYNLEKQFQFLRHLYLFGDDLIFPFYRRLFEKIAVSRKLWGNEIWLTSHLQDIIMDIYPNFYTAMLIKIDQNWRQYPETYKVCNLISIEYDIEWPLNIIITLDHMLLYKEIFNFLLTLKWALFTLNRLSYTDLVPRKIKNTQTTIKRLMCLRYYLINLLSNIQHYIFGFVFNQWQKCFELDFEKANDLQSMMAAHSNYINSIYGDIIKIRDCKICEYGYESLLVSVNLLKSIWMKTTTSDKINNCYKLYLNSFNVIYPFVNPTYMF